MTFTVTVRHEDGLIDTSTTMTASLKDLALAFVIYRERVRRNPNKQIFLSNNIEYKDLEK